MNELALIHDPNVAACLLKAPRDRILAQCREPRSAAAVARQLALPRQQVAYHVRELERAGLLEEVARRRVRNCTERLMQASARRYLVATDALGSLSPDPGELADAFSSAYLVASAQALAEQVARQREAADGQGLRLPTLALETEIAVADAEAQAALAEDLQRAVERLVRRHHRPDRAGARALRLNAYLTPAPAPTDLEDTP